MRKGTMGQGHMLSESKDGVGVAEYQGWGGSVENRMAEEVGSGCCMKVACVSQVLTVAQRLED